MLEESPACCRLAQTENRESFIIVNEYTSVKLRWCPNLRMLLRSRCFRLGFAWVIVVVCVVVLNAGGYNILYFQKSPSVSAKSDPARNVENVDVINHSVDRNISIATLNFSVIDRRYTQRFSVFRTGFVTHTLKAELVWWSPWNQKTSRKMIMGVFVRKMWYLTTRNFFNDCIAVDLLCRSLSGIRQRPWGRQGFIFGDMRSPQDHIYPRSLIQPELSNGRIESLYGLLPVESRFMNRTGSGIRGDDHFLPLIIGDIGVETDCEKSQPSCPSYGILYAILLAILGSFISYRLLVIGDDSVYGVRGGVLIPFCFFCCAYGFGMLLNCLTNSINTSLESAANSRSKNVGCEFFLDS